MLVKQDGGAMRAMGNFESEKYANLCLLLGSMVERTFQWGSIMVVSEGGK